MDYPAFRIPGMGPIPLPAKETRVVAASNGFIVYMRNAEHGEDIRIANNAQGMLFILQEYFKTPLQQSE